MLVVACNKCGETVQDDPQEALGVVHMNGNNNCDGYCGGTFISMSEDAAELLAQGNTQVIQFGTHQKS